tara:strand:- start:178 stop:435 length:258 start_codon:yes stop_codon:yes gene_type:complete
MVWFKVAVGAAKIGLKAYKKSKKTKLTKKQDKQLTKMENQWAKEAKEAKANKEKYKGWWNRKTTTTKKTYNIGGIKVTKITPTIN